MNKIRVEDLLIEDVFIDNQSKDSVNLYFFIDDRAHLLPLIKRNEQFVPDDVIHIDLEDCPLCQYDRKDDDYSCSVLSAVKEDLFRYLVTFPSIRLEWLYV